MGIWEKVRGSGYVAEKTLKAWRIVEDQSKSITRKFVDSTKEHDLLEGLIDNAKPNIKTIGDEEYFKGLHYLLSTPFRYPPLRWGSRFGSRFERSLLYASLDIDTAMSEKAFYKLAFLKASDGELGGKTLSYTAFRIHVHGQHTINLCEHPFTQFKQDISSKTSYHFAQTLGKEMRENHIECFQYVSARCNKEGYNIGVLTPRSLQNNPKIESTFLDLQCFFTRNVIEFSIKHDDTRKYVFPREMFIVDGEIPLPPDSLKRNKV